MICRGVKTIVRRFFALFVFVAVAVLSGLFFAIPAGAYADETPPAHDEVFGVNHANATALSSAYLSSGSFYLDDDFEPTQTIDVSGEVNICLHGHTIDCSASGVRYAFELTNHVTLNIYDCGGAGNRGKIIKKSIRVYGGTLNMFGGEISDAQGRISAGGGVTVSGGGTFNLYDGVITGNKAGSSSGGGGVDVGSSGTFNMYGGEISNNTCTDEAGAGVCVEDVYGKFAMYGGSIINNYIDYDASATEEHINLFCGGAGVYINGGQFSLEGDVKISGNVRGPEGARTANNLELLRKEPYPGLINITGPLGNKAKICVNMPKGILTNGYYNAGNRNNPSTYFSCDNGLGIGFDVSRKECAVTDSQDADDYDFVSAEIIETAPAEVGDTSVTFTVKVNIKKHSDNSPSSYTEDVTVETSPLALGKNVIDFNYEFSGYNGLHTEPMTGEVVADKKLVTIEWVCYDPASKFEPFSNSAVRRICDGVSITDKIAARYDGYDGERKEINGLSSDMIVKNSAGNVVTSTATAGEYKFTLAPSDYYIFHNSVFTLRVDADDEGYYKMQDASVVGVAESADKPTAGDRKVTLTIKRKLVHTKDLPDIDDTENYTVSLPSPLHAGENEVKFVYEYRDSRGGVQNKNLTAKVDAQKKTVSVVWYFFDSVMADNSAKHVYDGVDASNKILAAYDGIEGTKVRVDGASSSMLKKDKGGNTVASLGEVGEYTLSLAAADDYEFENNSFAYTVVKDLAELTDLIYEESGKMILGVSREGGFESGTELVVERVSLDENTVDGIINAALNVKIVKDSAQIAPTGKVTVHALIPDELRNGTPYKIYNLKNGVTTELQYTSDGNYAIFETDDLSCVLFVTDKPVEDDGSDDDTNQGTDPGKDPGKDPGTGMDTDNDGSDLMWLCILAAVLVVAVVVIITVVYSTKRGKKSVATSEVVTLAEPPAPVAKQKKDACPKCGRVNADAAKFCGSCGTKLEEAGGEPAEPEAQPKPEKKSGKPCPKCGKMNGENAKFCGKCGTKLD